MSAVAKRPGALERAKRKLRVHWTAVEKRLPSPALEALYYFRQPAGGHSLRLPPAPWRVATSPGTHAGRVVATFEQEFEQPPRAVFYGRDEPPPVLPRAHRD